MGKIRGYSEIEERGFREIYSVSELRKKEVVGNAQCSSEENMFVTSALMDCETWFQTQPAVFLLLLHKLL